MSEAESSLFSEGKLVGVDVGGTFIDIVVIDEDGTLRTTKMPTSIDLFSAIQGGLTEVGASIEDIAFLVHGTTVATNVLVQKNGARALVVMTKGFRDILEIRRTDKGELFDLHWAPPRPIVERLDRLEIEERISWEGEVVTPLDEADVDRLSRIIEKRDAESVAIVFLHSYVNPVHERRLKDLLAAKHPDLHISISSEVVPSYREFERTATTAANAYIVPVLSRYVDRLGDDLESAGFSHEFHVMQSNGGISSTAATREIPAKTVRSGPAGGTVGMAALARRAKLPNLIGLDIGGTTADVSIVWDERPKWTDQLKVEFGLPILFPAIDIVSIGAGGGTIAWIDKGNALRMGPHSAGAEPGPACYGMGGEAPTSTDAQLILGRLSPSNFLGGRMEVIPDLSEKAILDHIASPLGLSVPEAAEGMTRIMANNMIQAIRLVTIERGYDPRDFALCAFGGGGPLYAAEVARELAIPRVVVPRYPGVFAAHGMLQADIVYDASQTLLAEVWTTDVSDVEDSFRSLEEKVLRSFDRQDIPSDQIKITRYADLLYSGQTHTQPVEIREWPFSEKAREAMAATFHEEHERRFGHSDSELPIEFVNLRVFARHVPVRRLSDQKPSGVQRATGQPLTKGVRSVLFPGVGFIDTPVLDREALAAEMQISGPVIVEQMDTTIVIPPDMSARVDDEGANLIIDCLER